MQHDLYFSKCKEALDVMAPLLAHPDPLHYDPDVLTATQHVTKVEDQLQDHLCEVSSLLHNCSGLQYVTVLGQPFVFEVSKAALTSCYGSELPPEMLIVNKTKTLIRFRSEKLVIDLLPKYTAASEAARESTYNAAQRWMQRFVGFRELWRWLNDTSARWDVLCSLAEASSQPGELVV